MGRRRAQLPELGELPTFNGAAGRAARDPVCVKNAISAGSLRMRISDS